MAAQDEKSILGKILLIDTKDPKIYQLVSMGHRNVPRTYFDKNNKILISTEHGPMGGDEVNVNKDFLNKLNNLVGQFLHTGNIMVLKKETIVKSYIKKHLFINLMKSYGFTDTHTIFCSINRYF